ncbi:unnamed protein product [Diatraea saccharalis]|uniref:Short-chain dehydrogenase/reductase 3 n=1 Tax=Diatraea saccharalis TaxID=40085 RepID=A0A9N9RHI1_9NEOP|nr:unnamed protein product [Diatraea saccharalis]
MAASHLETPQDRRPGTDHPSAPRQSATASVRALVHYTEFSGPAVRFFPVRNDMKKPEIVTHTRSPQRRGFMWDCSCGSTFEGTRQEAGVYLPRTRPMHGTGPRAIHRAVRPHFDPQVRLRVVGATQRHSRYTPEKGRERAMLDQAEEPLVIVAIRIVFEFIWTVLRVDCEIVKALYKWILPSEPKDVSEDVILITGAGHGMGREVALRFGRLGATVVCVDINAANNEETAKMIKNEKGKAFHYVCDVTDRAEVFQLADKVQREVGDVTILLNNAGIMPCKPLLKQSEKEIRTMMDINVNGILWALQAFLPAMLENNNGHIVSMSSMAGLMGLRNIVPYCGSKFAVRGIMEALAMELHEDRSKATNGIKFTTIYPTMVNTGLCHNPRIRFKGLTDMVEKEFAADQIVDAIRREYLEITIPSDLYYANKFIFRILPYKAALLMNDFFGTGLDPHD